MRDGLNPSFEQEKAVESENALTNPIEESSKEKTPAVIEQKKETAEDENVVKSPEAESETAETSEMMKSYKGKIYWPITVSAAQVRKKNLIDSAQQTQKLPAGVKPVKVPAKKPKYARR